ncbi:MAG: B12-binding domain-containing radical SAM protein [Steroidobacteraceae bacterium]|nr:B12-binding domain-containing radical SAM protein [Deltaproteobacteria bacterium]
MLLNPPAEYTAREYADHDNPLERSAVETEDFGLFPPLGLLYILSALKARVPEHETFFMDCIAEHVGHEALSAKITEIRPDVVGITSYSPGLYDACLAARTIRKARPRVHLCLGGHHPIAFPFEAAQLPEFDSIVVGEGEDSFPALVKSLATGEQISTIPGVYTKESIQRHQQQSMTDPRFLTQAMVPPAYVENIDLLPMPDRSVIQHIAYRSIVGSSKRLATMISSRGCPYRCTYCDVPYKLYRQRSIVSVSDEIRDCLDKGYEEVHFYDDLFNIQPERVISFCDEIKRRGYRLQWDFRGRVNNVTWESLARAKEAGCRMISFGVETGSDDGLRQLGKNTTTTQIQQVFQWCRSLGILTIADFMIGLPFEESAEDVRRNIDFLMTLNPDYAQFSILTLYPNTKLFAEAARRGLLEPERWQAFSRDPSSGFYLDHWEEYLSIAQLLSLQKEAYRRFYLRPSYVWRSMISTCTWHEFSSKLYGMLKLLR